MFQYPLSGRTAENFGAAGSGAAGFGCFSTLSRVERPKTQIVAKGLDFIRSVSVPSLGSNGRKHAHHVRAGRRWYLFQYPLSGRTAENQCNRNHARMAVLFQYPLSGRTAENAACAVMLPLSSSVSVPSLGSNGRKPGERMYYAKRRMCFSTLSRVERPKTLTYSDTWLTLTQFQYPLSGRTAENILKWRLQMAKRKFQYPLSGRTAENSCQHFSHHQSGCVSVPSLGSNGRKLTTDPAVPRFDSCFSTLSRVERPKTWNPTKRVRAMRCFSTLSRVERPKTLTGFSLRTR